LRSPADAVAVTTSNPTQVKKLFDFIIVDPSKLLAWRFAKGKLRNDSAEERLKWFEQEDAVANRPTTLAGRLEEFDGF
jgi:hypothetical protein